MAAGQPGKRVTKDIRINRTKERVTNVGLEMRKGGREEL
jgi:hypothetical protein